MAPSYIIPALARSFEVIDCISKSADGIAFSEIVKQTGAPKASIFRILHTLEHYSWVEKKNDRYYLDYMFIHYGMQTLSRRDLAAVSQPHLQRLMEDLGATAHLAVLSGKQTMLMAVCESTSHIKLSSPVGTLLPLHCTSHGKLFLAYCVDEPLETFLADVDLEQRTERTLTSISALEQEAVHIRRQGYSIDDLELFDDVRCCAAPVFDGAGHCIGAVGITATRTHFSSARVDSYAARVVEAAAAITRQMGGVVPQR